MLFRRRGSTDVPLGVTFPPVLPVDPRERHQNWQGGATYSKCCHIFLQRLLYEKSAVRMETFPYSGTEESTEERSFCGRHKPHLHMDVDSDPDRDPDQNPHAIGGLNPD